MKIGDEVFAVESSYAIVRHGFIVSEECDFNGNTNETIRKYVVNYNDHPPYISYPTYGVHLEKELFNEKGQAFSYASYLRRFD